MLEQNFAGIYGVETKRLIEQLNKDLVGFPEAFFVSAYTARVQCLEVANCELKNRARK